MYRAFAVHKFAFVQVSLAGKAVLAAVFAFINIAFFKQYFKNFLNDGFMPGLSGADKIRGLMLNISYGVYICF